ncbi:acidic phospholipase A2 PA4-like isoform X2 [Zootermopsis nevadensis]|uniref:acidic phospholipase A2 PA4-like isoform X2 n=1 Tax=Zootermopsis nevadensis TaxID=136037 RepID=UPI000B8E8049|nr:acidic phospholipase A2 PA4-like isoform X2 [Zootermopsis nevadensis]
MKNLALLVSAFGLLLMTGAVRCVVLMTDPAMTRLVAISGPGPTCVVYNDRSTIRRMILESDPTLVREVKPSDLIAVAKSCRKGKVSHRQGQGGFIYPDTKWCGPGNVALDYEDLGTYAEEDKCCREHDHCPDQLEPGQCLYGLCNNSPFTRSHCDCDAKFRRCLQSLNTDTANTLGALFFNVAQVTCFTESRPCPQSTEHDEWEVMDNSLCPQMEFRPSGPFSPLTPYY